VISAVVHAPFVYKTKEGAMQSFTVQAARSVCVAGAIGLALLVPSSAFSVRSANSSAFVDPTGDSGIAPDISSATVSNDDQGTVTFSIAIANRPELGPTDFDALFSVKAGKTLDAAMW
jgi:hypothetical protein